MWSCGGKVEYPASLIYLATTLHRSTNLLLPPQLLTPQLPNSPTPYSPTPYSPTPNLMGERILIVGNHPLAADLERQYRERGDHPVQTSATRLLEENLGEVKELCLLSDTDKAPGEADNEVMGLTERLAERYDPQQHGGRRLLCHLLLRSNVLLHMMQTEGLQQQTESRLEVYPFTIEEQWSRKLALSIDREPITRQSEKTAHLLIFGMTQMAEQVAVSTAYVAHFPNYTRNHSLRTRITLVDPQADSKAQRWIQRYKPLFDNSYHRMVCLGHSPAVTERHVPQHQGEDFVDVEWEFVKADVYDPLLRDKAAQWAGSDRQLLTVVFADNNESKSLDDALHLPGELGQAKVPVYVYMKDDTAFRQLSRSAQSTCIRPFGMMSSGYDISLPLIQMAKAVNYIYSQCRTEQQADGQWLMQYAAEIDHQEKERMWSRLPANKRMSSLCNAMTIGVKMRSIGLKEDDWQRFYDISEEEIEMLSEVEHNRWSVEELLLGWRPCSEQEQQQVEADISQKEVLKKRKIHYDLRAYNDLRPDDSGKPVQIYDRCLSACIPLIAKESNGQWPELRITKSEE